jgi:hypothetical protein
MPEEELHAPEVDPGVEQMRREGMPKQVRMDGPGQLGGFPGLAANAPHPITCDGRREVRAGKEPGLRPQAFPRVAQQREEARGEQHQAIALAFTLADADHHALTLDVAGLELTQFRGAEPSGIEGSEDGAVFEMVWGDEQGRHFGATEDERQPLLPTRIRDILHHPGAAEGGLVAQASGRDRLNERAPGDLLLEQPQLVRADVRGA